ncbi:MAG: HD domain-containing protein, partial [Clostridiales bacterium]|nr:HD domain-containing protein [Clostridiales bacterium]
SDLILGKPAKLTSDEFEIMKSHVLAGVEAIERVLSHTKKSDFLDHAMVITGTHHEKWDGSGYPIGLSGASIPLEGRLMALVDVYDALISERPYKKPLPHAEAVEIIKNGAGKHFDPNLVDIFLKVEGEFAKVASGMTEGWD